MNCRIPITKLIQSSTKIDSTSTREELGKGREDRERGGEGGAGEVGLPQQYGLAVIKQLFGAIFVRGAEDRWTNRWTNGQTDG